MQNIFDNGYYTLKDDIWLENQRHAGKVLIGAMKTMEGALKSEISTKQLNDIGEEYILDHKNCTPTFKGYMGFPEATCISLNKELVHGIPKENRIIKDGDIVKLDCGVTYKGAIADMARTFAIGEIDNKYRHLIKSCVLSLYEAIKYLNDNIETARIGDIGYIISKTAKKVNANVITDLSGHGISYDEPHALPVVSNMGEKSKGLKIHPGMVIAIEPMLTYAKPKIHVEEDNWTITLLDVGVHQEDTIFVHKDRVEVITKYGAE